MATTTKFDDKHIFSEFEDAERLGLIKEIVRQDPLLANIPRCSFFPLWFSNISMLRELVAGGQTDTGFRLRWNLLGWTSFTDVPGILAGSKQLPEDEQGGRREASQSPQGRSDLNPARNSQVLDRDGNKCVLTKHGRTTLQIAHIVLYKVHTSQQEGFWRWMEPFWGVDEVRRWKTQILGAGETFDTEKVQNMMALACHVDIYWDQPICAFRPIRVNGDNTRMDIAFHWLPLPDKKTRRIDKVPIDEHPYPGMYERTGFTDSPGENISVFDMKTRVVIPSGHIFTITTDDPVQKPLPSFQLLELQWILTRIAAMQGAGGDEDSDMDYDGDSVANYNDDDGLSIIV
ncbi:uncharacterized protein N7482_007420 [Penicillium canariense]|uniref:HNH nuclease domain-containing protein n=1 Tax=Penicillium canariense TaxID=189055 RepID=A0A9W9HZF0_9EURO|nr:uncharacterized protein N7482_007420 [Penicillium canariense]KAJ5160416.1 hypothetical protein N7482_007420 [Penicillium canariense]